MSSHGRRRPGPDGPQPRLRSRPARSAGPAQLGWALLVIAAALIGGLAAATLVHTSLTIAVIVSVVAGGIAVVAVFRSPARPPELRAAQPAEDHFGQSSQLAPQPLQPARGPARPLAPAPSLPLLSLSPVADPTAPVRPKPTGRPAAARPPGTRPWSSCCRFRRSRERGAAGRALVGLGAGSAAAPSPGAKRAPAPDLSTYLASTFIAQCPRCGAFRLDIRRARSGWDFRCEACEYTWTWQPGTPWPPVRVMPRGRREVRYPPAP